MFGTRAATGRFQLLFFDYVSIEPQIPLIPPEDGVRCRLREEENRGNQAQAYDIRGTDLHFPDNWQREIGL